MYVRVLRDELLGHTVELHVTANRCPDHELLVVREAGVVQQLLGEDEVR